MQTYSVYLDISSTKLTLAQMSKVLGRPDAKLSRERGRLIKTSIPPRPSQRAMWRKASSIPESTAVDLHLKNLLKKIANSAALAKKEFEDDVLIVLNLAIYFDEKNAFASTMISTKYLKGIIGVVDSLYVSAYPCSKIKSETK